MKKNDLLNLAMLGISAGLLMTSCERRDNKPQTPSTHSAAIHQMPADIQSFYSQLSPDAQQKFLQMDNLHRKMSVEMLNHGPQGQNSCKGLGGCQGISHSCAGLNDCKGQGGARPLSNPNQAVDVQYNNQHQQRGHTTEVLNQEEQETTNA
jgi:hypothetical protein